MVRIQAAALLWAWAQISSGGNSGASAASDTRGLLTLLCTHQHDASRTSLAHMRLPAIHPSAWKRSSANFVMPEFSEVRISPAQSLWVSLAAIGCLRVLSLLPHNSYRTRLPHGGSWQSDRGSQRLRTASRGGTMGEIGEE